MRRAALSGAGALSDVYNGIILLATFTTLVPYAFCAMAELLLALTTRRNEQDHRRLWVTVSIGAFAFIFSCCEASIFLNESCAAFLALAIILSAERFSFRRASISPVGSTTAIRVGSPLIEKINAGTRAKHAARNGSSSVPMTNDHFITTLLYSCLTIARNFFILQFALKGFEFLL